jgi:hypothetical protein
MIIKATFLRRLPRPCPRLFPRAQRSCSPECPGARRSAALYGLDRHRSLGEGRTSGVPWDAGLGKGCRGRPGLSSTGRASAGVKSTGFEGQQS